MREMEIQNSFTPVFLLEDEEIEFFRLSMDRIGLSIIRILRIFCWGVPETV